MGRLVGFGGKEGSSNVVSFLLGAALPTALLFFLASDRLGQGFSTISSAWRNGTMLPAGPAHQEGRHTQDQEVRFEGLAELLPKVAMEDRTVILTSVNEAWTRPNSLLHLHLDSYKNGDDTEHLLNHVLVVALDRGGFDGCRAVHPHCYLLETKSINLSSAKRFMTKEYLDLVWTKLSLQQRVLELGYNFLFTDADILWFRNPFRHIAVYADMSCSADYYKGEFAPMDSTLNTGFYYMKSTSRSIEMIKYWRAARARFPGNNDQEVFSKVKNELGRELQAKIAPLETVHFSGFCEYHDDMEKVCTMHANCCIGLENKVHDLKGIAADWKNYTSRTPEERRKGSFKWTAPARCWKTIGWHA